MKAFVIESPSKHTIGTVAEPKVNPGELLLKVRMVGFCGSDVNTFVGTNPLVSYPRIPGHEIAATVVQGDHEFAAGTDVTLSPYTNCGVCSSCRHGRPNACKNNQTMGVQRDGALTEYISVPRTKVFAAEGLEIQELCLVEPLTVGFHAAARGRVTAHDTVAVLGCGGVGLGAIASAAFRGAKVIAVDMDDAKLGIARDAGAAHVVNTRSADLHNALSDLTEGHGPDVIIEAIGTPETFRAAVEEVAWTGRVVYIGYAKQAVSYETRLFVMKELDILGSRNALPEDFEEVIRMLKRKRFPVQKAISCVIPMEEAGSALQAWSDNRSAFSKIMVKVS